MSQSQYWFVPRKSLYVPHGMKDYPGTGLRRADSPIDLETDQLVRNGDSFTILLKSFYVTKQTDKEGNDLLVRSWTKYGSNPQIESFHFFKKNVSVPFFCKETLASEHVFAMQNHLDENLVWVRLQILEVDGGKVKSLAHWVETDVRDIVQAVGAVFPGALPLMGGVFHNAFALFGSLKQLIQNDHDLIFETALDWCSPNSGETPFRYGVYVFFEQNVQGDRYKLREFKVEPVDAASPAIPQYMMVEIVPHITNVFKGEDILFDQELATGLLVLDDDGKNQGQREKRLQYLQHLMKKAKKLDDLLDYRELKRKQASGEVLTPLQQERLKQLSVDLSEYLSYLEALLQS